MHSCLYASIMSALSKKLLLGSGLVLLILLAVGIGLLADRLASRHIPATFPSLNSVAFTLPTSNDTMLSNRDLLGQAVVLFFGFTHCPEICPTTLFTLRSLLDEAQKEAPSAADIQVVFVTVDPERDTPEELKHYLEAIDPEAIGLTGTSEAITQLLKGFGIYAEKVALEGGDYTDYTMDHTATVFLYGRDGNLRGTIAWGEPAKYAKAKLIALAKS